MIKEAPEKEFKVNTFYKYPDLPEGYYWKVSSPRTPFSYARIALIKQGRWFDRQVDGIDIITMYAYEEEGYLGMYDIGSRILTIAEHMVYDNFPSKENVDLTNNTTLYYIKELPRGKGSEKLMQKFINMNFGTHQPGDTIYSFTW